MHNSAIYHLIRGLAFFESIPDDTLMELAQSMRLISIKGGEYLLKQGEHGDCLYILAHGRMLVTVKLANQPEKKIGEIGVGDMVGEMALLTDMPRSASVRAVRDCDLIQIDRNIFQTLIKEHTSSAMNIVSECVKRLQPNFTEKKHGVKSLCILSCDQLASKYSFCKHLVAVLEKFVKLKVIKHDDEELKRHMTQDRSALITWLNEIENNHDLVIYETQHGLSEFTQLAVSQADKILRLTTPQPDLESALMRYLNQPSTILAEQYLIILHEPSTKMPQGTAELLKLIPCSHHFHLAKESDYQRLARFLLGTSVSVVFSGGGLRGIAHHGLIQAFYEAGIPIDMTAGTSFGALPGVFSGMNQTPGEMLELWKIMIEKIKKVVDVTLPLAAITKGEVLYRLLSENIPHTIHMEDLWIPFFCVATNLSTYKPEILNSGPAWEAVRASMSIPGVFPPVIKDSQVLVDGASMNNLPVDYMSALNNQGTIIASVASGKSNLVHYRGYAESLSGWTLLGEKFHNGGDPIAPGIVETLISASLAASTSHQDRMEALADYTFDLGVDQYKLLDIDHWEEIRETGYQTALRLIKDFRLDSLHHQVKFHRE